MTTYLSAQLIEDSPVGRTGQRVRFALNPSDVHIAHEIDTLLAGIGPQGYRADEACPVVLVEKETDTFRTFGDNNVFQQVEVRTSRQASIREVDIDTATSTYLVEERALGAFIPRATQDQATFDVKARHAMRIQEALGLDREIRIFGTGGLFTTTANWNANNVATLTGGGAQWDDPENCDPILDIQERIEASAQMITGVYMNPMVGHRFLAADRVRSHMRQMLGDNAPNANLVGAASIQSNVDFVIPGLPPFHIVAGKVLNETTSALDFILADSVVGVSFPNGVPRDGMSTMTAVTWRERGLSGNGFTTREFDVQSRGLQGGSMMVSGHAEDEQMVASNCGFLLSDVLEAA